MTTWVAFLRGINVGRAKRIAMADLRALCESLGHSNVRTVLNSGNVDFESRAKNPDALARAIESALETAHGFNANTVCLTLDLIENIVRANPLGEPRDAARFLIAFPCNKSAARLAAPLQAREWSKDRIALTPTALYIDAATGLLDSALVKEFMRITKEAYTTRNWSTVQKVLDTARSD
jgi:uncharacterized protein (DUF1697 family)